MKQYKDVVTEMDYTYNKIQDEHYFQHEKWGIQNRTLFEWMCYLSEEVGELAEAISENEYRNGPYESIEKEATQVAALACKIIEIIQPYIIKKEDL